jgi:uncharacterized repeat protein (TIGR01451 family)
MSVAVFTMGYTTSALAVGTASGTDIVNRATVNYEVGAVPQALIESAPGAGNSTPGATNGTDTVFEVDNLVDLTVAEVGGTHTVVVPGSLLQVTEFTVTNTGNTIQDYDLAAADLVGGTVFGNLDNINADLLQVFVDDNSNGVYDDGVDVSTFIDELAADATETVFIVATIPALAVDGNAANVALTATTHDGGTAGGPIGALTVESAGPDNPAVVDIVFGDAGNDALETDQDSYLVVTSTLTVVKASAVISDPINGTTNPFAIPGAVMEYTITITNGGGPDATSVSITDAINANVTFQTGTYNAGADDVEITVGTAPTTYCTGDAADADLDGCGLTGAALTIAPGGGITVGTVAADNPAVIRFRVAIN